MSTEVKRLFNRENIEVYINRPRSMDDILHKSVTEYGQKEAVRLEEDSLSYKELEEKSFLLASILYHEYQIKKETALV
ncbi:hypothetical protein [Thalassobacillus sp. C254]|uniref:hypothetical protein n=1 Tax=Thalassobacillus sp. C254 TaxID=1225341 RepID=UPI0006CFDC28|nr:hypothetical protein [Thalassobacillus sp. C254]